MKKALYILVGIIGTIIIPVVVIILLIVIAGIGLAIFQTDDLPSWATWTMVTTSLLSGIAFAVKWRAKMKRMDFPKKPLNNDKPIEPPKPVESPKPTAPPKPVEAPKPVEVATATEEDIAKQERIKALQELRKSLRIRIEFDGDEDDSSDSTVHKSNYVPASNYASMQKAVITKRSIHTWDDKDVLALNPYAVVDVETTGLNCVADKIIEIGIVTVKDGEVSQFTSYINPEREIPREASKVSGIYGADVANAPTYSEIAPTIKSIIEGIPLIAHNATFDINFLEYLFKRTDIDMDFTYLDTLSLARRNIKGLPNYKLGTLVDHFNIELPHAHRAGDDAYATMQVFEAIKKEMSERIAQEAAAKKAAKAQEKAERLQRYGASPLFDANIVFTGEFDTDRSKLEAHVAEVGANLRDKVNTKTKYLVVGRTDNLPDWALERKLGLAEKLIADGKKITLISETEYLELIRQAKDALNKTN